MKKYPKVVQCDARGQIVIPKDVRQELKLDEGSAFWLYSVTEEGILLKIVPRDELSSNSPILSELKEKASKIQINPKNLDKAVSKYKKTDGRFEEI